MALNLDHPRLLVALVVMLDQFRRNMYRESAEMYACDARCLALVKRASQAYISALSRYMLRRNWSSMTTRATSRRGWSRLSAQWS